MMMRPYSVRRRLSSAAAVGRRLARATGLYHSTRLIIPDNGRLMVHFFIRMTGQEYWPANHEANNNRHPSIHHPSIVVCDSPSPSIGSFWGFQQPVLPSPSPDDVIDAIRQPGKKENFLSDKNRMAPSPGLVPDPRDNMTPARRHLHTRKYPPTHHETPRLRPKKQMKSEIISQSCISQSSASKMCSGVCVGGLCRRLFPPAPT